MGSSGYGRAVETLGVLRQECMEVEHPRRYNAIVKELKREILGEELGGDRKEMWLLVRKNRLGLVRMAEHGESGISEEDAKEFLSFRSDG